MNMKKKFFLQKKHQNYVKRHEDILMLYGDVPLISVETLTRLREAKPQGGIGLLTVVLDDPTGYGRITRENGNVTGIVEHKDASEAQRQIQLEGS